MKTQTVISLAVLLCLCMGIASATDTVSTGTVTRRNQSQSGHTLISLACTTDNNGDVLATTKEFFGQILRVTLAPNTSSALAPTNLYDVTLTDVDGVDVFQSLGYNCSSAAAKTFVPMIGDGATSIPITAYGALTLRVDNAGPTNNLTIRLLTRP